ncbi:TetR/AcrR family transcriptional regulator [Haloglycomyces albus]|uniref:TetR/AcrR family transcriptional regulator n=1 Tax=Haloglycomyces albus TaxID=526067 RepID=UPI00046D4C0D|nr:TetR/AcrR family transcriptional regulator [Haloglycomyces albus]
MTNLTFAARRILDTAAELFYTNGINSIGVERIAAEASVTKKTIYDRFGSKDALILAYLSERDECWRHDYVDRYISAAPDSIGSVLAVFDALEEWITDKGDRGCAMLNARAELAQVDHPSRTIAENQKAWLRDRFVAILKEMGLPDAEELGATLLILHEGAIVMRFLHAVPDAIANARRASEQLIVSKTPCPQ